MCLWSGTIEESARRFWSEPKWPESSLKSQAKTPFSRMTYFTGGGKNRTFKIWSMLDRNGLQQLGFLHLTTCKRYWDVRTWWERHSSLFIVGTGRVEEGSMYRATTGSPSITVLDQTSASTWPALAKLRTSSSESTHFNYVFKCDSWCSCERIKPEKVAALAICPQNFWVRNA